MELTRTAAYTGSIMLMALILSSRAMGSVGAEVANASGRKDTFNRATTLITTLLECLNKQDTPQRIYPNKPSPKSSTKDCFKNGVLRDLGNVVNLAYDTELDNERLTNVIQERDEMIERQTNDISQLTDEKGMVIEGIRALQILMEGIQNEVRVLKSNGSQSAEIIQLKEDNRKITEEVSALKTQLEVITGEITELKSATAAHAVIMQNQSSEIKAFSDGHSKFRDLMEIRTNLTNELLIAIEQKNSAAVHLLVELGADVNSRFNGSQTPLHRAAAAMSTDKSFALRTIKFLIENDADPYAKDDEGRTFLHRLVDDGTTLTPSQFHEIASLLVSRNASEIFNYPENISRASENSRCLQRYNSSTTFQMAVRNLEIQTSTLSMLRNGGVNFNAEDSLGDSVLCHALQGKRSVKFLADLVQLGGNPRHQNKFKENLLQRAARFGNVNEIKFFLDQGLDINSTDGAGWNPLHEAVFCNLNALEAVPFLIEKGVNVRHKDKSGNSPLDRARESGRYPDQEKVVQLVKEAAQ